MDVTSEANQHWFCVLAIPNIKQSTDRQLIFDGVVEVKPACIHFIRNFWVRGVNLATAAVDEPESRQQQIPAPAGCDLRHLVQNEDEDEDDDDFEDVEQRDWILAETEVERLTQKMKMKSRECEQIQRPRVAIAEKLKGLEQREQCTLAEHGDNSDG